MPQGGVFTPLRGTKDSSLSVLVACSYLKDATPDKKHAKLHLWESRTHVKHSNEGIKDAQDHLYDALQMIKEPGLWKKDSDVSVKSTREMF